MDQKALAALKSSMRRKVPNAKLEVVSLPLAPKIKLALIDGSYPQAELSSEQVADLMDNPPYWAFCWASGHVLAAYLLDNPEQIAGKTIIDFGCGSGVVAIAAALAGAQRCIALDLDNTALLASKFNAQLNNAKIELSDSIDQLNLDKSTATLLVADVFYDAKNIPLLQSFISDYADVIVADSRVKPSTLNGMFEANRYQSCTVPDLAEASDFNSVGLYRLKQ